MIVAVLARHAGIALGQADVFVNVAGGVRIDEPGADLAVALAIASAAQRRPCAPATAAFGEIGLTGRLRPATQAERRLEECAKLGLAAVVAPVGTPAHGTLQVTQAETLRQAIRAGLDAETDPTQGDDRDVGPSGLRRRARVHAHALGGRPARAIARAARGDREVAPGHAAPPGDRRRHPLARGRADRHRRSASELAVPLLRRHPPRRAVPPAAALRAREDGRRDHRRHRAEAARVGERAADARPDDPVGRDRDAPPHRRARRQADRRARRLGLAAARDGDDLRRPGALPARPGRRRAREDEPGARRRSRRTASGSSRC